MKKITLVAATLISTLTVGAFAHGMQNQGMQNNGIMNGQGMQKQGMMNKGMQSQGMQNKSMMNGQGMGMMSGGMMNGMQMFSQLNLSQDQKFNLSILKDEMRLEMRKLMHNGQKMGQMGEFIKSDSFDKNSFKKHMNEKHEKMLNLRANNMEKAFKILTKEQITELKKNLVK